MEAAHLGSTGKQQSEMAPAALEPSGAVLPAVAGLVLARSCLERAFLPQPAQPSQARWYAHQWQGSGLRKPVSTEADSERVGGGDGLTWAGLPAFRTQLGRCLDTAIAAAGA